LHALGNLTKALLSLFFVKWNKWQKPIVTICFVSSMSSFYSVPGMERAQLSCTPPLGTTHVHGLKGIHIRVQGTSRNVKYVNKAINTVLQKAKLIALLTEQ
jgi:hypothetical protein